MDITVTEDNDGDDDEELQQQLYRDELVQQLVDEFGPTDPYFLQLSDLWSDIEIKEEVYSRALEELAHTTQCIDNAKDDKEKGVHVINTISPYRSKCVVQKGSLKEKWIIQNKRLSLAEKNVTKAWKEYEHVIAFLEGLSQLQNLLHEYEAQEPQLGDVEIDRSILIWNLSCADVNEISLDPWEIPLPLEPKIPKTSGILKLQHANITEWNPTEEICNGSWEGKEVHVAVRYINMDIEQPTMEWAEYLDIKIDRSRIVLKNSYADVVKINFDMWEITSSLEPVSGILEMEKVKTLEDSTRCKILPNFKFRKKIVLPIYEICTGKLANKGKGIRDDMYENSYNTDVYGLKVPFWSGIGSMSNIGMLVAFIIQIPYDRGKF